MRYELSDYEWTAIKPMLPNKLRGVRRVNDRRGQCQNNGKLSALGTAVYNRERAIRLRERATGVVRPNARCVSHRGRLAP